MTNKIFKETNDASGRKLRVFLSGGGDDIERILNGISEARVFSGKRVAYVAIAAETNSKLLSLITGGFDSLKNIFQSYGATSTSLITSHQYDEVFNHDVIVLSGGDTSYLLNILREKCFINEIKKHQNINALIGISAGAIALSSAGVGTLQGRQHEYCGLGLVDLTVVTHSNPGLARQYSDAVQLKEYDLYECSVQID